VLASRSVHRPNAALAAGLALAAALAAAPGPAAADDRADLWLEGGAGLDTNPHRAPGPVDGAATATLLGRLRLPWSGEGRRLVLTAAEAGRLHAGASGADAIGSRLDLAGRLALAPALALLGSAAGSDYRERDGQLDRAAARGALTLALDGEGFGGTLTAGWSLFAPRLAALRPFRADGPEAWLGGRWSPAPGHQLTATLGGSRSYHRAWPGPAAGATALRVDEAWGLEAGWSWQGPALLGAAWGYTDSRSDVAGGDFQRHRLSASLAVELPAALTLAGRAAVQWTRYPDPLLLAAQQALAEGQENLDRLELRLSRPLAERLEVALTGAWTHADGGAGVAGYQRLTIGLVLAWRAVLPWP